MEVPRRHRYTKEGGGGLLFLFFVSLFPHVKLCLIHCAEIVEQHYNYTKMYIGFLDAQHKATGLAKFYYNYGCVHSLPQLFLLYLLHLLCLFFVFLFYLPPCSDWVPPAGIPMCSSHLTSSFSYMVPSLHLRPPHSITSVN